MSINRADCQIGLSPEASGVLSEPRKVWVLALAWLISAAMTFACAQQGELPAAESSNLPTETKPSPDLTDLTDPESIFPHSKSERFWLSGQVNFIFQAHAEFPAKYSGANSLNSHYEKATSRVTTLYTGVCLNSSTELLVDIEEAGGQGLSTGLGVAGAPNLDVVRNPLLSKAPYIGRAMIHKVFAFSKDKVDDNRSFLSLFNELPRRRLEIRFGKFSMPDFFDLNSAASDTHLQFTNWSVDNNGAWDYAADTRGYTVGVIADYEDQSWGFRFGEALMPKVANGIDLVWRPWQVHAENWEYELRRGFIPGKTGAIRLLAYTQAANMGISSTRSTNAISFLENILSFPPKVSLKQCAPFYQF